MLKKTIAVVLSGAAMSLAMAAPASAHTSTCRITSVKAPKDLPGGFMGGTGAFRCDAFSNHHEYIGTKTEMQILVQNLPGTRFDIWRTVIGPKGTSPARANTERTFGTYFSTAPCMNGTKIYSTKFTINMVGAHGVVSKSARSERKVMDCGR